MKKLIASITVLGLVFSNGIFADEACAEEPKVYFTDEDSDLFNKGKFVGKESDDYLRAMRRARQKNWAFAAGTTLVGVLTMVLVGKNHHKTNYKSHPIKNKTPN